MATNPYGTEVFEQFQANPTYIPVADDGSAGPVPAGTKNQYGTALWIPSGYPIATQPYMDSYGRVILRPFRVQPVQNTTQLNIFTAYIGAALQYAVSKYSLSPYNVMAQTKLWSGPAVIQSYFNSPPSDRWSIMTRLTMGSWDPDWANPSFPVATLSDSAFNSGKTLVLSVFKEGANTIVPGLGDQLENAINQASAGGLTGTTSGAAAQLNQQDSLEQQLLAQTQNILLSQTPSDLLLYAAAVVVIILIILMLK